MNLRSAAVTAGLVLALAVAGCTRKPEPARASAANGPACVAAASGPSAAPAVGGGRPVPDLALPCLDGRGSVHLARLGTPAVVNLWATWCGPCRQELPAFQRYAERVGDRLRVIGVVTRDRPEGARSFAAELGLRFPMVVDTGADLMRQVGVTALPATLFVDAQGRISYLYNAQALDQPTLERLGKAHLGVVLP